MGEKLIFSPAPLNRTVPHKFKIILNLCSAVRLGPLQEASPVKAERDQKDMRVI